ncbi:MAG: mechanosensitive ion channel domain-containing protein [Halobacteriaceae archaeon]
MAVEWRTLVRPDSRLLMALAVVVVGVVAGYVLGRLSNRFLSAIGVPAAVEGTSFERTAQSLGTSTVALFSRLLSWFIYGVSILLAFQTARLFHRTVLWARIGAFIPDLFFALFTLAAGFVAGDKAELTVRERLSALKIREVSMVPRAVKYTVVYVALLVALGQVGVATNALLILLLVYAAAVIVFAALALRDTLPAAVAGYYLLLQEPYGIGDTVQIGAHRGVVQEVSVFVTRIESDGEEYIVPNHLVFREGVVRIRD